MSHSQPRIETGRLTGEPISHQHRDLLNALHTDPKVMATLGGARTQEETDAFIDACVDEWKELGFGQWMLFDSATGAFVGRCGLRPCEVEGAPEIEILYAIASEAWGRGYATEASQTTIDWAWARTELENIVAFTLPTNHASQGVMKKSGLRYERDITHANLDHVLYRIHRP